MEGEAAPDAAEAAGPGLGLERVRLAQLRLPPLRLQARRLRGRRAPGDLADPGPRRPRQHRRLVDRADRLREVRRLDSALGDPRPRGWFDAAQLPLQAADRGAALLAAPGHDAPAPLARQGAADEGLAADAGRRPPLRRRDRLRRSSCSPPRASTPPAPRPGSCRPRASPSSSASSSCSASATRSRSSAPVPRSTGRCSPSASSRSTSGSSPGSSSSSSSGGAAASSKLNRHFPFVVSTMMSNAPLDSLARLQAQAVARLPGGHAPVAALRWRSPISARCRSSPGRCSCSPSTTTRSGRSRSSG